MVRLSWLVVASFCLLAAFSTGLAQEQEPQEEEKNQVVGQVTVDGEPLEGAVVKLEGIDSEHRCEEKTDPEGKYACRLPAGRYQMSLAVEGRTIGRKEVEVQGGVGNQFDVPLRKEMLEQAGRGLKERFDEAVALNEKKSYREAIPILEQLLQEDPSQWAFHTQLAVAYGGLNRWEQAIEHYHEAIERKPELATLHIDLADVLARAGNVAEARKEVQAAVELNPDLASTAYYHLGVALYQSGQMKGALDPLRQAIHQDPKLAVAHYLLGLCLYSTAETKVEGEQVKTVVPPGTRESFERYLELKPNGRYANDAKAMLQALEATAPAEVKVED